MKKAIKKGNAHTLKEIDHSQLKVYENKESLKSNTPLSPGTAIDEEWGKTDSNALLIVVPSKSWFSDVNVTWKGLLNSLMEVYNNDDIKITLERWLSLLRIPSRRKEYQTLECSIGEQPRQPLYSSMSPSSQLSSSTESLLSSGESSAGFGNAGLRQRK